MVQRSGKFQILGPYPLVDNYDKERNRFQSKRRSDKTSDG